MKKQRLGIKLCLLVESSDAATMVSEVSRLTGSLGVRASEAWRATAERSSEVRATSFGPVRYKFSPYGTRPEADEVSRLAKSTGLPWSELYRSLVEQAQLDRGQDAAQDQAS